MQKLAKIVDFASFDIEIVIILLYCTEKAVLWSHRMRCLFFLFLISTLSILLVAGQSRDVNLFKIE